MTVKIPTTVHILFNLEHWIIDAGASVHSTMHPDFVYNCCPINARDSIVAAQGTAMLPHKVGELIGVLMNKEGKLQFHLFPTVKEIHVVPQGVFNLWSVTKSLTEGLKMMGDADAIELTGGSFTFCFDIKVPTIKGVLHCMCLERIPHETEVSALATDAPPNEKTKLSIHSCHA